jgi:hypothetical protein
MLTQDWNRQPGDKNDVSQSSSRHSKSVLWKAFFEYENREDQVLQTIK